MSPNKAPRIRARRGFARNRVVASVLGVVAVVGVAWWAFGRPDPQLERVRELQAAAFTPDLPEAERREKFRELRETMESIPEEKRDEARRVMSDGFEASFNEMFDRYAAMTPAEKTKFLDERIDEMERMRKDRGGRGGPPGGRGFDRGRFASMSEADRNRFRKERLDNSTPEGRARRAAFFGDLNDRRQARGLPAFGPPVR